MVWHHTLICLPGLYSGADHHEKLSLCLHDTSLHDTPTDKVSGRVWRDISKIYVQLELIQNIFNFCRNLSQAEFLLFWKTFFRFDVSEISSWWAKMELSEREKNSDPNMVTIKPHSAGEVRKESVGKLETIAFFLFLDSQNLRRQIATQIDHNLIISPPEFGHSDWEPRAAIQ